MKGLKGVFPLVILAFFLMSFSPEKKISLEVYNTDVKGVLMLLSESQGLNLVCGDGVKGTVTLRMKGAKWIDVINLVSRLRKLSWRVEGGTLFVFPKEVTKRKVLEIIPLNYSSAKDISERVSKLLSEEGTVEVDERTNSIIVQDYPENVKKIKDLVKKLDKRVKQILVMAKIVSVDYSHVKDIGIQWGGYYYRSSGGTRFGTSGSVSEDKIDNAGGASNVGNEVSENNMAINLPAKGATSSLFLSLGKLSKSEFYRINTRLTALIESRKAEVLSEPKVLTIDNKSARIGQGVEIPYQTTSDQGTKTEFRKAELSLYVKPKVNEDGDIFLEVTVTRDSEGEMTDAGPTINTQRVQTCLLLKDGETAVIGGIVEQSRVKEVHSVPFFSKVPLLGRLFKRKMKSKGKREVLVFITPKILGEALGGPTK